MSRRILEAMGAIFAVGLSAPFADPPPRPRFEILNGELSFNVPRWARWLDAVRLAR
jgi:hypothetical protein